MNDSLLKSNSESRLCAGQMVLSGWGKYVVRKEECAPLKVYECGSWCFSAPN